MKLPAAALAAMLVLADTGTSHAVVRIANDRGGQIGRYVDRFEKLRASGQTIIIDGLCASACTIGPRRDPLRQNLCNAECQSRFPRSLGFRAAGTRYSQPGSDQRPFFDVSSEGPALDRQSRRPDSSHDLSARQAAHSDVSPLLHGRPSCGNT
jgi:hypothetical protein